VTSLVTCRVVNSQQKEVEHLSADHAERIGSRSADTLHVAAAMLAGARRFLSFDKRQRELAKAAGLQVKPCFMV